MSKNFFTGRTQLYQNRGCSDNDRVSVSVSIGDTYIENNIIIHAPVVTVNYYGYDEDELKPLFKKVK